MKKNSVLPKQSAFGPFKFNQKVQIGFADRLFRRDTYRRRPSTVHIRLKDKRAQAVGALDT